MPYFETQGFVLAYEEVGNGPVLVLLHGWGADGSEWREFGWEEVLASDHHLLLPDVRGHGRSSKPHEVEAYEMRALAGDVVALLDRAGTARADVFGADHMGAFADARFQRAVRCFLDTRQ